jgi:hypothetical protein
MTTNVTIDELKSLVGSRSGMAMAAHFMVELPSLGVPDAPREMNILCKSVTMPGKSIFTHDRRIDMLHEKVAYGYSITEVTMTFILLNDYGVKNYFDTWRSQILNEETLTVGYRNNYARLVKIHQLKKPLSVQQGVSSIGKQASGGAVHSVELIDAFPTIVNSIELGNNPETPLEVNVTLSYTNWRKISAPGYTEDEALRRLRVGGATFDNVEKNNTITRGLEPVTYNTAAKTTTKGISNSVKPSPYNYATNFGLNPMDGA